MRGRPGTVECDARPGLEPLDGARPPDLSMTSAPAYLSRRLIALVIAMFAVVWFGNLDTRKLIHPDEGRYAEIPREMLASGDWVTPRLNGLKYFEKPPLQYWMTAAAYRSFGLHEWTARLWPALSAFAAILVIGYAGCRLGGPALGLHAGLALAGMVGYIVNSHFLSLDAGLAAFLTVALAGFLVAQRAEATSAECQRWMLVAWGAMAGAMLSKGLIGLVLPGGALVTYTLLQHDFALWRRLHIGKGLLLFLALTLPWFVLVSRANPDFLQFFFVHEHFQRFLTTEHRRTGAWWYFVPLLLVGSLPWLLVLLAGARRLWSGTGSQANGFSWQRFALAWSCFVFAFFSLSGSKLPSYILPLFPSLALLVAWLLPQLGARRLAQLTLPLVIAAALVAIATLALNEERLHRFLDPNRQSLDLIAAYRLWIAAAMAVSVAGGLIAFRAFRQDAATSITRGVIALSLSGLIAIQVAITGFDVFRATRSSFDLLQSAQSQHGALRSDVPFYQVRMYDQTASFYLRRTTTLVEFRDEMALGIDAEPQRAIATVDSWRPLWAAQEQGYALLSAGDFSALSAAGLPMRELARDQRRVLVSRR
jgi:4-amino-4-deoxy-L-arabinose transferase-like glycosyltransferase